MVWLLAVTAAKMAVTPMAVVVVGLLDVMAAKMAVKLGVVPAKSYLHRVDISLVLDHNTHCEVKDHRHTHHLFYMDQEWHH